MWVRLLAKRRRGDYSSAMPANLCAKPEESSNLRCGERSRSFSGVPVRGGKFLDLPSPASRLLYQFTMNGHSRRLEIIIGTQCIQLWDGTRLVREWSCSTSKFGIGFVEGSNKTPLGGFSVKAKHGAGAAWGTIFKAREPVGVWCNGQATKDDLVLTRILRLDGLEERNANTFDRYIYIHGTNDERGIGRCGSHGCVRMRNMDVIDLFDQVPEGTPVWIGE